MKILYLDCGMGAAGDMLSAAVISLLPDPQAFVAQLNTLGLPGITYRLDPEEKCGIRGFHMHVYANGAEEAPSHVHSHNHEDEHIHEGHTHSEAEHNHHEHHHHAHHSMQDVTEVVNAFPVSEGVREHILSVFHSIAEAESTVHGVSVPEIHFHEVGTMDAIADVTAFCLAIEALGPDRVLASPVRTGYGQVHCAHGILPVPAPATELLLRGIPVYAGDIEGELCTPTGAALLKSFAEDFGPMPLLRTEKAGYGMGTKDLPAANCVRAILGTAEDKAESLFLLECNLDDMTGEEIAFASEELFAAGARDVHTIPCGMKKGRPGVLLRVLTTSARKDTLLHLLFLHTTTLGVREFPVQRYRLERETEEEQTPYGTFHKKKSHGFGVTREKYEYEDLASAARTQGTSLSHIRASLENKDTKSYSDKR